MLFASYIRATFTLILTLACLMPAASTAAQYTAHTYDLRLTPDLARQLLHGQARLGLVESRTVSAAPTKASAGGNTVDITAPSLTLLSARLNGRAVQFERSAIGWRVYWPHPRHRASSTRTLQLTLSYTAAANEGLVFGPDHVYTAYHACHWLPCASAELTRVAARIRLQLQAGFKSVASTWEGSPANARQRYPLYTLGFAAGRFHEALDATLPARLRYLTLDADSARVRTRFADTARMLAFFEAKAGVPLPAARYTQVLVPGNVAQEASNFSMVGSQLLDPILEDPQEDWVIAHEMAHQWWGNLITCAAWNDFWLNEGIVVFMTAAWKQQRWGEAAYQREMALAQRRLQRARDAGFDKPLSWPGDYPSLAIKRAIHYSKGALFMDALRMQMGDAAFWAGLRRYTQTHAGSGVTAADFERAMQAATTVDLRPMFAQWVGERSQ